MRSSPEPVRTTVKSSGALPCGSAASQRLTPQVACWRSLAAGSFPEVLRPTALAALPVHVTRALPARYVPSPGFGYPPDGFLPAEPRQPCFRLAALVGLALQRFLTTAVVQPRRLGRTDPWFSRLSVSRCEHRSGGRRRHLSGLPRSSARNEGQGCYPLACPCLSWAFPLWGRPSASLACWLAGLRPWFGLRLVTRTARRPLGVSIASRLSRSACRLLTRAAGRTLRRGGARKPL
jgi:hypothetical protein